jgi:hypothetical protein
MRPAQLLVFDGLRITTDHVNHLQGTVTSGLEDFRRILGLGKAQTGLGVSVQDDGSITVQPGVAFDYQGNRLSCDDPLNLKVAIRDQDESKFICLKYERIEEGAVEGHPTMIWDSCSGQVRDALPDPKENLITLARITKQAGGKLSVRPPLDVTSADLEQVAPLIELPIGTEQSPSPAQVPRESARPMETNGAALSDSVAPVASVSVPAQVISSPNLAIRQGVVQLVSDPAESSYLSGVLIPTLRQKLGADSVDFSFTLGQTGIAPDIAVASFSTECVLTGKLVFSPSGDLPERSFAFESSSGGEATITPTGILQFGASNMQLRPILPAPSALWSSFDMTARGVAQFEFGRWADAPDSARLPLPADIARGVSMLVQILPAGKDFQIHLKLLWSGKVVEDSLKTLQTEEIGLAWHLLFGWKAIGSQT